MPPSAPAVLEWGSRIRLHVLEAGLACCAVEVSAAVARHDPAEPTAATTDAERVDVLLVSGTVTDRALPGLLAAYAALPHPRVVAYGACTATGGPYWDSYSVTKGIDQVVPVDLYVPGCPPRPEALAQGLARLEAQLLTEAAR
jgi:NADH-quinone oxidoreductase subunit B